VPLLVELLLLLVGVPNICS